MYVLNQRHRSKICDLEYRGSKRTRKYRTVYQQVLRNSDVKMYKQNRDLSITPYSNSTTYLNLIFKI